MAETLRLSGSRVAHVLLGAALLFGMSWGSLSYLAGERAGLLEDDSFFYAQIAYNTQAQGLFSFDGVNATSGFHPLWAAVLACVAQLMGLITQSKVLHLAAYLTIWFGITWLLARRIGRTALEKAAFFALALLTTPLMETAMLSLLLVCLAELLHSDGASRRQTFLLFGLSFLIPLARIDSVPIVVCWVPLAATRNSNLKTLLAGLAAGLALHFAIFGAGFGYLFSVSSVLKSTQLAEGWTFFRSLGKTGVVARTLVLVLLSVWGALTVCNAGVRKSWRRGLLFGAPVAFSLGHVFVSDMRNWYFLPGFAFAFLAGTRGGAGLNHLFRATPVSKGASGHKLRLTGHLVVGVSALLIAYKFYRFVPLDGVRRASWAFVEEARELLPGDARLYQVDGSGFTGYWLERSLFNGDGLVNTYEYARRKGEKRLSGYLVENGICYVITDAPIGKRQRLLVNQGGLQVSKEFARELLRSEAYGWSKNRNAHFILWQLKRPGCD